MYAIYSSEHYKPNKRGLIDIHSNCGYYGISDIADIESAKGELAPGKYYIVRIDYPGLGFDRTYNLHLESRQANDEFFERAVELAIERAREDNPLTVYSEIISEFTI